MSDLSASSVRAFTLNRKLFGKLFLCAYYLSLFGLVYWESKRDPFEPILILSLCVAAQVAFLFGAGISGLRPVPSLRRLIVPASVAALFIWVLVFALLEGLSNGIPLIVGAGGYWGNQLAYVLLGSMVIALLLLAWTKGNRLIGALSKMSGILVVGSLLALAFTVPAYYSSLKGGGMFPGLREGISMIVEVAVLVWSLGPAIFLVIIRDGAKGEGAVKAG